MLIVLLTVFEQCISLIGTVGMAVSATTAATVGGGNAPPPAQVSTDIILARKRKAEDQHDGTVYPAWALLLVTAVAKLKKCRNADVRTA